jgi:hypothetical protein
MRSAALLIGKTYAQHAGSSGTFPRSQICSPVRKRSPKFDNGFLYSGITPRRSGWASGYMWEPHA